MRYLHRFSECAASLAMVSIRRTPALSRIAKLRLSNSCCPSSCSEYDWTYSAQRVSGERAAKQKFVTCRFTNHGVVVGHQGLGRRTGELQVVEERAIYVPAKQDGAVPSQGCLHQALQNLLQVLRRQVPASI